MKKLTFLGLMALGFSMMSFTSVLDEETLSPRPPIITHECPNGYEFEYFDDPALTNEDHEDIQNSVCNDPNNEPAFTPA